MEEEVDQKFMETDDVCSICLDLCTTPVRCKGPCHKPFCVKCAAQAKCSDDRCPNRCSNPFEVESIRLAPRCPFSPKDCIIAILTQEDIYWHHRVCPYISKQQMTIIQNKQNYKCDKGHLLTFLPKEGLIILYGKYWIEDAKIECASCNEWNLCRSICMVCSQPQQHSNYCYQCRIPPCTKKMCPLGHKLKTRKKPGKYRFCDLCDVPAGLMSSKEVHGFCPCDFDICAVCYSKLPNQLENAPLKWSAQKLWPLSLVQADSEEQDSNWQV